MNFNRAIIVGNLTKDPEMRTTPSGQNVANFSIATNRIWKDQTGNKQQQVEFHNIVAFGRLAEICSQYLKKGGLVMIEGRIQTRSWQGQDGIKRYRTEIITENMQLGPRNAGGGTNFGGSSVPSSSPNEEIPTVNIEDEPLAEDYDNSPTNKKNEDQINVDEIPF